VKRRFPKVTKEKFPKVAKRKFPKVVKSENPKEADRVKERFLFLLSKTDSSETNSSRQAPSFGNPVPEKATTRTEKPVYNIKIVREEEVLSPLRAVVKIGQIEPQRATLKDVSSDVSKATVGQKWTLEQPTYRDYIVNKKQARRPLSCDGSSAFSRLE